MAVAISQTANPTSAGTGTTITYSNQSIGTAAHDRIVVLAVGVEAVSGAISSATINFGGGAVAMNSSTNGIIGNIGARIFWLQAPVGTTATFAVTFGSSISTANTQHIAVYSVTGAQGTAASSSSTSDTDADPISSGAITIPTSGGHISVYAGAANGTTRTWTGVTKGLETATGAFDFDTGTSTTAGTPTITVSGGNNEDAALAWVNFAANASIERLPAQTNLTLSTTAPTKTHFDNGWTISPAANDLAISPTQPAVGMAKDLNSFDLALSTTVPTFAVSAVTNIDVPQGNVALSTTTPSAVTSGVNLDISSARVDLVISRTAPAFDFGRFPLPGAKDLVISTTVPAVEAGVFKTPATKDLALSPTVPTAFLAVPRDPAHHDLVLSPTVPSVVVFPQFTHSFSPATKDLVISPSQPAVGVLKDLNAADLLFSTTVPTPIVSAANNTTIVPTSTNLVISPSQPAVGLVKDLNAADLLFSTTAPAPVVQLPLNIVPARVDLVISSSVPSVTVSAANNITKVPDTRDLAISGSQPAVGLVKDLNSVDLSLSTTAPSKSVGGGSVNISPLYTNLLFGVLAPDSSIGSNIPIGQLVISTTAPTRTVVVGGFNISPARVDLVISRTAPTVTVSAGNNTTIVPDTRDLAISTTAPTVLAATHTNLVPSARDLVISTTVPSVAQVGPSPNISPPSVNLLFSTVAASVIRFVSCDPPQGNLVLSTTVPTVVSSTSFLANPPQANLVLSKVAPDVDRAVLGQKVPPRCDLVISTTAPTVSVPSAAGGGAARSLPFIASMGAMMTR